MREAYECSMAGCPTEKKIAALRAELDAARKVVEAAMAVRMNGSDYRHGTHAKILWELVDDYGYIKAESEGE